MKYMHLQVVVCSLLDKWIVWDGLDVCNGDHYACLARSYMILFKESLGLKAYGLYSLDIDAIVTLWLQGLASVNMGIFNMHNMICYAVIFCIKDP